MPDAKRTTVLAIADWYLPGSRAGGPVRSIAGLVESLGHAINFFLVTRDRDVGDGSPYVGVDLDNWNPVGYAQVWYLRRGASVALQLTRIARSWPFDVVYLNSIFSSLARSYLLLRRLRLVPPRPLIVAPRGELGERALKLKHRRKCAYLILAKALGLYDGVVWAASSMFERDDVRRILGPPRSAGMQLDIRIVPNIVSPIENYTSPESAKQAGKARIAFLSRIDRKKNLDGALRMLQAASGDVRFDVYGPTGDVRYLEECRRIAQSLPANVQVRFLGELPASAVARTLREYDLFLLPTLNENFGHVIIEALGVGCPVLISDQTAWRGLEEKGAGWDVPLDEPDEFVRILTRVVAMDANESERWRRGAWSYAAHSIDDQNAVEVNRALFEGFGGTEVTRAKKT
jgi:glycosyltransferase involved in cell wall biosynthesis